VYSVLIRILGEDSGIYSATINIIIISLVSYIFAL
jgi:hypothetical protein